MNVYRINERDQKKLASKASFNRNVYREVENGSWLISDATMELARPLLSRVDAVPVDAERFEDAKKRLVQSLSAQVHERLPEAAAHEAYLYLYSNPRVVLEYVGRGHATAEQGLPAVGNAPATPSDDGSALFALDKPNGKRKYYFRRIDNTGGAVDHRFSAHEGRVAAYRDWLTEPNAKLVVSLGGGGFRMFAATTILRSLDVILGDRSKVAEIWGSSGGSFLGYAYAHGFDPWVIDEFGFDMHHSRHAHLTNGDTLSLVKAGARALWGNLRGRDLPSDMSMWLAELDKKQPESARTHPHIPFFAVASNAKRSGTVALADPRHIDDSCREFVLPCDARHAVAASTAVPFLLRGQKNITGKDDGEWMDGSLSDENPISFPVIKWIRERKANPSGTPEKLKILLVHLNLRTAELGVVDALESIPFVKKTGIVGKTFGLVDMLLETKTQNAIQMAMALGDVEILSLKLTMGTLNFKDPRAIASSIHAGRWLQSWKVTTYRKSA